MKREILCETCGPRIEKHYKKYCDKQLGERYKIVRGRALKVFNCDSCNAEIKPFDWCFAVSHWSDHMPKRTRYDPWEHEYILFKEEDK